MKIRDKLLLGFGLYVLLACCGGFFAYREIGTIGTRMMLVEIADDITNTMLEVRRYEKNYLLYKDEENYREMLRYLDQLKKSIDNIEYFIRENSVLCKGDRYPDALECFYELGHGYLRENICWKSTVVIATHVP